MLRRLAKNEVARMRLIRISINIAILFLLIGVLSPARGQSGRVKSSPKKATVALDPVDPSRPVRKEPKKSEPPKFVDGERIYRLKELDPGTVIEDKPTPGYTREARKHLVHGIVVLRAILAADRSVTHIEVVTGLPFGLTERAIEAARRIKFKPGMKDGEPASIWVELEYRFSIY